jgi:hypothetical protein
LESQLKVASLQDMSCQLLVNAEGTDCLEAKEKVHVIGNRLKLLLKEVSRHIKELEKLLDMSSSQQVSSQQTSLCRISCRRPNKHHLYPFQKDSEWSTCQNRVSFLSITALTNLAQNKKATRKLSLTGHYF